jgi:hypothetical protein
MFLANTLLKPRHPLAMSSFADIINKQFAGRSDDALHGIQTALRTLHSSPNTLQLPILDSNFQVARYLLSQGVKVEMQNTPKTELFSYNITPSIGLPTTPMGDAENGRLVCQVLTGSMKFRYKDTDFIVYKVTWAMMRHMMHVVVFDVSDDIAKAVKADSTATTPGHELVTSVYRWVYSIKDTIWVFEGGCWQQDKPLWEAIQGASWNDIVLEKDFLEGLRRDTRTFFESAKIYKDIGVTWKRGLLLLGPPGNGKTESIKVLLKESGQSSLYVKSFSTAMVSSSVLKNE